MPERIKKILIVGCGYRGKRIAVRLIAQGYAVRGMTRSAEHAAALSALGIEPFIADVTKPATLDGIGEGVDAVYHLMGSMSGNDTQLQQLHVDGTRNLLNALNISKLQRYIYESSTAVYGQISGEWIDETAPRAPASTIGKMRVQAEDLLLEAFQNQKLPLIILRPSSIYRPEGVINKKIKDGTYALTSDPEKLMNHIYVDDFLQVMVHALTKGMPGEAYNVCDDEPKRWIDYANTIADLMNVAHPRVEWKDVDGCAEVVRLSNKRCSNAKLKREFGIALQFPTYREGLKESARQNWREAAL
jgi:nucleoside-diphosphate-sugar epimerase